MAFGLRLCRKQASQRRRILDGASPSRKSVQRLKDKVGEILVPGNTGAWTEVRDRLNRLLRG